MPKRKRRESKAKQQLGNRKRPSFWKRNRDIILIMGGLIADKVIPQIDVIRYVKLFLDNLF